MKSERVLRDKQAQRGRVYLKSPLLVGTLNPNGVLTLNPSHLVDVGHVLVFCVCFDIIKSAQTKIYVKNPVLCSNKHLSRVPNSNIVSDPSH